MVVRVGVVKLLRGEGLLFLSLFFYRVPVMLLALLVCYSIIVFLFLAVRTSKKQPNCLLKFKNFFFRFKN